jgi:hypothetical protein
VGGARARLLVCGWHEESPALLAALERHAGLRAVAVGDASAAQLVRAREATRLPGYQHLHEMARGAEYEALLLERPTLALPLAEIAAERGADLLVRAASVDGDTLAEIAETASRHGVALVTLRPALRLPGFALVATTAGAEPGWRPSLAELSIEGPSTTDELLRDAVGALVRLLPGAPTEVLATAVEPLAGVRVPADGPYGAAVQLRYAEGRVASIVAREAAATALRLRVAAPLGTVALDARAGWARLSFTAFGAEGEREDDESELSGADPLVAEATHVRNVRAGARASGPQAEIAAADARRAPLEAATLRALEHALATSEIEQVSEPHPRPTLRLLEGSASERSAPRGRLRLVPPSVDPEPLPHFDEGA